MRRLLRVFPVVLLLAAATAQGQGSYVNFETIPTRPVALSPDGSTLAVTNTPDNRVEIFGVTSSGLVHLGGVPVGLEPVAVNFRTDDELWVVNHLSDSVSLVDTSQSPPRVTRTLLVGDEPGDVVFGGTVAQEGDPFPRAFVSAARRGQNHPANPKTTLLTPGIGRADVWVFDATTLGSDTTLGGTPLTIVQLFGDKPRPLAVSSDGATVYAGIFHSGNQTTSLFVDTVNALGGLPPPTIDADTPPNDAPDTGLIVKFDPGSGDWVDQDGTDWSPGVPWSLPDEDVFAIDATASPPVESAAVSSVGTVLFNMAVHPTSDKLYVSNTEANNLERFEGRRDTPGNPNGCNQWTSVRGHLHEARVSVVQLPGTNDVRRLNKHIVYGPGPAAFTAGKNKADSLSTPAGLAFSPDNTQLYVAAFGSSQIGVFNVAQLDNDSFSPDSSTHIAVSGGGPAGMAVDGAHDRMYVYTRFDNALKTISDLSGTPSESGSISLHDVEPSVVTDGRHFLYDADFTSSNGEASCASCHVFGNMDDISWDLGDPCGVQVGVPGAPGIFTILPSAENQRFHPLKGPMTTQTLRGLFNMGPMHWRGDRTAGATGGDPQDAIGAFKAFNVAFDGLVGRDAGMISDADMTDFAEFGLSLVSPPNPHRNLTNDPENNPGVGDEVNGVSLFLNRVTDAGALRCNLCHIWNRNDNSFGGDGRMSEEGEPQTLKIPHFRNLYDKIGMFNASGDQIRGFGFLHDGSVPTVRDFVGAPIFLNLSNSERNDLTAALYAFDSNLAPSVGQQVTLTAANAGTAAVQNRINLLRDAAMDFPFVMAAREPQTGLIACPLQNSDQCSECELTVHGVVGGEPRGWVLDPDTGDYEDDRGNTINHASLIALANTAGQELTFTCVYPPGGERIGVDRDEDGIFDGEQCGDTNGDGLITEADSLAMSLDFAGLGGMPSPAKCNVVGPAGGAPAECNIADLAAELRHLAGLAPGLAQQCGALSL